MTIISKIQRARLYIYSKGKENCETFLCTKSQTLCKKQDNLRHVFIYKNPDTLRYAVFHEIFETGICIKKTMTLYVT